MSVSARRVAVVGNSHIGALRNGWKTAAGNHKEIAPVFFGAIAGEMAELRIQERNLVPVSDGVRKSIRMTSGGAEQIVVDDFDEFLVVAMGFSIRRLFQIFRAHRFVGLEGAEKGEFLVSRAVFRLALRDALESSVAIQTIRKIRQIAPEKRVVLVPQAHPRIAPDMIVNEKTVGCGISVADAPVLMAMFNDVSREIAAAEGVVLQAQGEETTSRVMWTDEKFGARAVDVNGVAVKAGDYEHMGAEYGVYVLKRFATGK